MPLTSKENESHLSKSNCYIFEKEFGDNEDINVNLEIIINI